MGKPVARKVIIDIPALFELVVQGPSVAAIAAWAGDDEQVYEYVRDCIENDDVILTAEAASVPVGKVKVGKRWKKGGPIIYKLQRGEKQRLRILLVDKHGKDGDHQEDDD